MRRETVNNITYTSLQLNAFDIILITNLRAIIGEIIAGSESVYQR